MNHSAPKRRGQPKENLLVLDYATIGASKMAKDGIGTCPVQQMSVKVYRLAYSGLRKSAMFLGLGGGPAGHR